MGNGSSSRGLTAVLIVTVIIVAGVIAFIVIYSNRQEPQKKQPLDDKTSDELDKPTPEMEEQAARLAENLKNLEEAMKKLEPDNKKKDSKLADPVITIIHASEGDNHKSNAGIPVVPKSAIADKETSTKTNKKIATLLIKPTNTNVALIETRPDNTKSIKDSNSLGEITALAMAPLLHNFDLRENDKEALDAINIAPETLEALKTVEAATTKEKAAESLSEIKVKSTLGAVGQLGLNAIGFKTALKMLENRKTADITNYCKEAYDKATGYQKTFSAYFKQSLLKENKDMKVTKEDDKATKSLESDPLWMWCMENYDRGSNYCSKMLSEMKLWDARSRMFCAIQRRLKAPLILERDDVNGFPSASYASDLGDLLADKQLLKKENLPQFQAIAKAIVIDILQDDPAAKAQLQVLSKARLEEFTAREAELALIAPLLDRLGNSVNASHDIYVKLNSK